MNVNELNITCFETAFYAIHSKRSTHDFSQQIYFSDIAILYVNGKSNVITPIKTGSCVTKKKYKRRCR